MSKLLIVVAIIISLVSGCASWRTAGGTTLTVSGVALKTTEQLFLEHAAKVMEVCESKGLCQSILESAAKLIDTALEYWWLAYLAFEAGNEAQFKNTVTCLVVLMQEMQEAFGYLNIVFSMEVESAIELGLSLIKDYGGTCGELE